MKPKKKMAILTAYFAGETYGLLGPQMAATVIREHTPFDCMVIAVTRQDDKAVLKQVLTDYFGVERPIIGFSTLNGREDLFSLAKECKEEGALTILAGPQADVDYLGEYQWQEQPSRFKGFSKNFNLALQGPAEQAIYLLRHLDTNAWTDTPGLLCLRNTNRMIRNPKKRWEEIYLQKVDWKNIYRIGNTGLVDHTIKTGQVLQQVGCPYAAHKKWVEIDYPVSIEESDTRRIALPLRGCSFCDVAVDKGFFGQVGSATVMEQILCLPETTGGRKIPFELINENPIPGLLPLLQYTKENNIMLSQINLTLRADWLLRGQNLLRRALTQAQSLGTRIMLSSVGFESFDDRILHNLNKGLNVNTNLQAIRLMRRLKEDFPLAWGYAGPEGANHGFIHPTPWDTQASSAHTQMVISMHNLPLDILPQHSIPLIIHHASGLGNWIREVEQREGVRFKRYGSIIGWWHEEKSS
jgi:hypothetical protein